MSQTPILEITNLSAGYGKSVVIRDVSLTVAAKTAVALIGPNGAGKSTLLRSVFAMTTIIKGSVLYKGTPILQTQVPALVRQQIIYVNQGKVVFPTLSVQENLMMPGSLLASGAKLHRRIEYALDFFPALKPKLKAKALTLSGGQRQQLALARALVQQPQLLLLDEPTLGLSPILQRELFEKLALLRKSGVAILMVEQNARSAINLADRTYLMENGQIVLSGGAEILANPMIKQVYLGGT